MTAPKRIVFAIGGATGMPYAARLLSWLAEHRDEVSAELVFTKYGKVCWNDEIGTDPSDYGLNIYGTNDMTAPFASGSAKYDGMVVVPCSVSGLARIATGATTDLVGRAADVMLKERKPLVLVVRETPLSLVHLRNMVAATEAGATILPPTPSFYSHPTDLGEVLDTVNCRILDHLGIDNDLMKRWSGLEKK